MRFVGEKKGRPSAGIPGRQRPALARYQLDVPSRTAIAEYNSLNRSA
jgi:hypothetical protein